MFAVQFGRDLIIPFKGRMQWSIIRPGLINHQWRGQFAIAVIDAAQFIANRLSINASNTPAIAELVLIHG
jgi:hypothetical protein